MKTKPATIGRNCRGVIGEIHYYPEIYLTSENYRRSLCGLAGFGEELPEAKVDCVLCQHNAYKLSIRVTGGGRVANRSFMAPLWRHQGLCDRCGSRTNCGKQQCDECKYDSIRRKALKDSGICPSCGKNPTTKGNCAACKKRQLKYYHRKRKKRLAVGMCPNCGKNEAPPGRWCEGCRKTRLSKRKAQKKNGRQIKPIKNQPAPTKKAANIPREKTQKANKVQDAVKEPEEISLAPVWDHDPRLQFPKTRGECLQGPNEERPCPWVRCRHHLITVKTMKRKRNPEKMEHTCSLDIADRGGQTSKRIGKLLNLTRSQVDYIRLAAFEKLRKRFSKLLEG